MLKNLIILPDGTELTSGTGQTNNIRTITLTECVNSSEELTLGSVCAAMVEVTVQTPRGTLSLTAGEEVTLCKVDNAGTRHKVGPFTLEKPTRASANILKLTGYDRVARLDKDLTAWLNSLTGWPYTLWAFAGMVCNACGLKLATTSIPNGDFLVQKITKEATGRQVMQWIGEVCCRFCRANADGEIELAWYTPAGISITPSGEHYFFQRGLTFEDYEVAPIDAVQLKLADSEDGGLWPATDEGANSYIITGNPILMASITDDTLAAIQNIRNELSGAAYTPCKVAIPATLDIHAGNTVQITDANGVAITALVMTKRQKGQRDTLECTGSPRRDSATAQNNKSGREKSAAVAAYADSAAKQAVNGQTQEDIFNKLTNNGAAQGVFLKDGQLYINASYLAAGVIASVDGTVKIDLLTNRVTVETSINGRKGKVEFTADGIQGYGFDSVSSDYYKTLRIEPGGRDSTNSESTTTITSGSSTAGIAIAGATEDSLTQVGQPLGLTHIMGKEIRLSGKAVSWKANSDGSYTLIGT